VTGLLGDLRAAWRSLSRRPALLAAGVATLAVGLAATTAVFSLVRAVLLHPLPYRDSGRLVVMWQTDPKAGAPFVEASIEEYDLRRSTAKVFEGVAAITAANYRVNLSGRGGLLLSAVATRGLSGLLFGVRPGDPGTLLRSAALLSAVAIAAGYLPARRAARTDPMVSLRRE